MTKETVNPLLPAMTERQKCTCCGDNLAFRWCDTHGVGACLTCGLPYTIYHYAPKEEGGARLDKPPEPALTEEGIQIARRYWTEEHRRVFPGSYDMGILPGRNTSYSGATREDISAFDRWYANNYPPRGAVSES